MRKWTKKEGKQGTIFALNSLQQLLNVSWVEQQICCNCTFSEMTWSAILSAYGALVERLVC